jgi:phospholipase/carboxylesterase
MHAFGRQVQRTKTSLSCWLQHHQVCHEITYEVNAKLFRAGGKLPLAGAEPPCPLRGGRRKAACSRPRLSFVHRGLKLAGQAWWFRSVSLSMAVSRLVEIVRRHGRFALRLFSCRSVRDRAERDWFRGSIYCKVDSSLTDQPIVPAMTDEPHTYMLIAGSSQDEMPLLLLHGSGGDEHDLVPLSGLLAPGSPILALRGTVAIDSGFAFFHRFPDRTIDEADISARVPILADFIETCCARYSLRIPPVAVGYSNGAIMAAALLLTRPTLLAGAILFRPLLPFTNDPPSRLNGIPVLIIDGENDSRRSPGDGARLAERLRGVGAKVTHHVLPVGHAISDLDVPFARTWLNAVARDSGQGRVMGAKLSGLALM